MKTIFIFALAICYFSCTQQQRSKEKDIAQYDSIINSKLKEKDIEGLINLFDKKAALLLQYPDSFNTYIKLNAALYDSALAWGKNKRFANKYYNNIILQGKKVECDSSLITILMDAYFKSSKEIFSYKYNDTAVKYFEAYLEIGNRFDHHDLEKEAIVKRKLGISYNVLGDIKRALNYYDQSNAYWREKNINDAYASGIVNSLIALNEEAHYEKVIELTTATLNLINIPTDLKAIILAYKGAAELNIGLNRESNHSVNAACNIIDTFTTHTDINIWDKKSEIYFTRSNIEKSNNNLLKAEFFLRRSIFFCEQTDTANFRRRDIGKRLIAIGNIKLSANIDSALSYYQQALYTVAPVDSLNIFSLPTEASLYAENTIMEALDAKAAALEKKYQQDHNKKYLETAVQCYALSFIVERKLIKDFAYDDSKLLLLKKSRKRSERAIEFCWQLQQLTHDDHWAEQAFLFAENNKAFVLLQSIKQNTAANSTLQNDENYQKVLLQQMQLANISKNIAEENVQQHESAVKILQAQKAILEDQLVLSKAALSNNNSAYRLLKEKEENLSVAEMRSQLLDDKTTLTEFFSGDSSVYSISFSQSKKMMFFKTDVNVQDKINNFLFYFSGRDKIAGAPVDFQRSAYELYSALGFASQNETINDRLIIIPDGKLNLVPFEALIYSIKKVIDLKQMNYLINRQELAYGFSAVTLLKKLQQPGEKNNDIVAFAPVFEKGERGRQPLLNSSDELKAIQSIKVNGDYFFRNRSSIASFKNKASSSAILHIATHAYADTSLTSFPGIDFYDSTLYLDELYAMQLHNNLVVLSACETNIGHIEKSEGPMSLARGFYYAGAKNIITSLWNVDDASTSQLFKNFYSVLSDNNYAGTLRTAKLDYIKNASVTGSSPYYWAGFVNIGYEKPASTFHFYWYLDIAAIIVLILIMLLIRQRLKKIKLILNY